MTKAAPPSETNTDRPALESQGLTSEMMASADTVFDDWYAENWSVIHDNGSKGDTHSLFAALWASWKKSA